MSRYSNWVEGEHAGDYKTLNGALESAVITANERGADVIVGDEQTGMDRLASVTVVKEASKRPRRTRKR